MPEPSPPRHVAVIMDGNGRWARARALPRLEGHRRGMETLRRITAAAARAGVRQLSVFAFSRENWRRPVDEVDGLLAFFGQGLARYAGEMREAGVSLRVVGETEAFPERLRAAIAAAERETAAGTAMTLNVLVSYSGQWDIARAARQLADAGASISEDSLGEALSLPWAGPVDLFIRTGGERRVSNFMLWQLAYAELWFTDTLWPDFDEPELLSALRWYAGRERRFGRTSEQLATD